MAVQGKKINELAAIGTVSDETVLPAVYVSGTTVNSTANKISIEQISTKVQNDMSTTLASKQDTLVSGTNIKTINNESLLGSGNLDVDGLPSQSGQSGKFLTTDGTNASWAQVSIPESGTEALLSMPTGTQALSDTDLYNYIKTMYDASTTTGTDYVLKPDVTITGEKSVNITRKGIASGFTSTSYINTGYKFNPGNNTWEVRCKFTTPSTVVTNDWMCPFSNLNPNWDTDAIFCPFIVAYNGSSSNWNLYSVVKSSDGTTRTTVLDSVISTGYFSGNTEYYLSCKWTGSSLVFSRYQNGSWVQFSTKSASVPLNMNIDQNIPIIFGSYRGANSQDYAAFRGTVDLPSFELYVNDELVYSPVNSLPFKKLATGSNVVDVSYKTIIEQIAQSRGSALYYIIDTANQTITLPKGDLFGFITQAIEK